LWLRAKGFKRTKGKSLWGFSSWASPLGGYRAALLRAGTPSGAALAAAAAEYAALQAVAPQVGSAYAPLLRVANLSTLSAIAHARGEAAAALEAAAAAVQEQTSWAYDEPPDWHMPMRQCLGRLQLQGNTSASYAAAEATYLADLAQFPENGWSLWGLLQSMRAQPAAHSPAECAAVARRAQQAWAEADVPLVSSCLAFDPF
jgi:hypothetical protein